MVRMKRLDSHNDPLTVRVLLCVMFVCISSVVCPYASEGEWKTKPDSVTDFHTTLSVNSGAMIVLSRTFHRLHLPINIERSFASNKSIVIGIHPAIPLNRNTWREAFGTSCRIRWFFTSSRLWMEGGIWGIYQRNKLGNKTRETYSEKLSDSMVGMNACLGYKYRWGNGRWVIQPFVGIAVPIVVFLPRGTDIFGHPFTWSGLGIGYMF